MNIVPINNKVSLRPIEPDKVTKSGIILPNSMEEKVSLYEVLNGKHEGRKVICSEYAGYDFEEGGVKVKIVDPDSIIAIYED